MLTSTVAYGIVKGMDYESSRLNLAALLASMKANPKLNEDEDDTASIVLIDVLDAKQDFAGVINGLDLAHPAYKVVLTDYKNKAKAYQSNAEYKVLENTVNAILKNSSCKDSKIVDQLVSDMLADEPEVEEKTVVVETVLEVKPPEVEKEYVPTEEVTFNQQTVYEEPVKEESKFINQLYDALNLNEVVTVASNAKLDAIHAEMLNNNKDYYEVCDVLASLQESIDTTMSTMGLSMEEKLDRVRKSSESLLRNQVTKVTLLEERVANIMSAIVNVTKEQVDERLSAIDEQLAMISRNNMGSTQMLTMELADQREKLIVEISTIRVNLNTLLLKLPNLSNEFEEEALFPALNPTSSPIMNTKLNETYKTQPVLISVITNALNNLKADREVLKSLLTQIITCDSRMKALIDIDTSLLEAYRKTIEQLKAFNVEELVMANNIVQQVLRIFTGFDNGGKSTIACIAADVKEKEGHTVALFDLTRNNTLADYGYKMFEATQETFNIPSKKRINVRIDPSKADLVSMKGLIYGAAEDYAYISVIVDLEEEDFLKEVMKNALTANFVFDPTKETIALCRDHIVDYLMLNSAGVKLIFNKTSTTQIIPIINQIGIDKEARVSMHSFPYLTQVKGASFSSIPPVTYSDVYDYFKASKI